MKRTVFGLMAGMFLLVFSVQGVRDYIKSTITQIPNETSLQQIVTYMVTFKCKKEKWVITATQFLDKRDQEISYDASISKPGDEFYFYSWPDDIREAEPDTVYNWVAQAFTQINNAKRSDQAFMPVVEVSHNNWLRKLFNRLLKK